MVEAQVSQGEVGSLLFVKDPAVINRLQRMAIEGSRHGIPLIFGYDIIHGLRTMFPVPIAQAASWDPDGVEYAQSIAALEARAVGIHWTFAPMVDIARDPRWGRIVEGAGEDPYLGAVMAAAHVRGFQGGSASERVLAGPKHFAGYGAARGGRDYDEVELSDSELHNVYLPPFKAAIDAGAATVMSAYMELNGIPASGNRWLLTDLLRGELGFTGLVVSDANAVTSLETQHFAANSSDAAVRALKAGLDMEMSMLGAAYRGLPAAVAAGQLDEAVVDVAVRRVLSAKFELGLFEMPWADSDGADIVLDRAGHRSLARVSAERSFVLLKNSGLLPLNESNLRAVAVIGELAVSRRDTVGPWAFGHDTRETVSILDGIRARLDAAVTVVHASGAGTGKRQFPSPFDRQDPTLAQTPDDYDDESEIEKAVSLAASADIAIVVVGERQNQVGEYASRSNLDIPGRQLEQLKRVSATGTPIVLLVMSGRPLDLRWADENVAAIMDVWYPGTRGGDAVARTLLGDVSPAGRLPFTWPRHVGHVPMISSHLRTFKPEEQGERYWDDPSTPLYPFGFGLSYASFEYSNLRAARTEVALGDSVSISVDVSNLSGMDADEVVQLYIHQRHGGASRPLRELKGFQRTRIHAGRTETVSFNLTPSELRYWSSATRGWEQEPTTIDVSVGGNSSAELTTVLNIVSTSRE